ncbi:hypothetical protein DFH09DRAFT_1372420 [Mycena vulgaris]|nr:hypothetical protein DFH09DRAFT_1372420 [Mycena vulgaris]
MQNINDDVSREECGAHTQMRVTAPALDTLQRPPPADDISGHPRASHSGDKSARPRVDASPLWIQYACSPARISHLKMPPTDRGKTYWCGGSAAHSAVPYEPREVVASGMQRTPLHLRHQHQCADDDRLRTVRVVVGTSALAGGQEKAPHPAASIRAQTMTASASVLHGTADGGRTAPRSVDRCTRAAGTREGTTSAGLRRGSPLSSHPSAPSHPPLPSARSISFHDGERQRLRRIVGTVSLSTSVMHTRSYAFRPSKSAPPRHIHPSIQIQRSEIVEDAV